MKITLGTSNKDKLDILKSVAGELAKTVEVFGSEVESGVSDQPIGSQVTKKGAQNRARAAYKLGGSDIGVGLEVGYQKRRNGLFEMICWAAIFDGNKYYFAKSHSLLLPSYHQKIINNGKYLGEFVRKFAEGNDTEAIKVIRETIIHREPFLRNAAHNALMLYCARSEY